MRAHASLFCLSLFVTGAAPLFGTPPVFEAREVLGVQAGGEAIAVGDVNGDGEMDIVAASENIITYDCQLNIFFGNAEGTYRQRPVIPLPGDFNPRGVAIGDFNQDGLADIAVIGGYAFELFIQQPSGSFVVTTLPFTFDTQIFITNIVAADINHDGFLDLIIPTETGTAVLLNSGAAHFQAPVYVNSVPGYFVAVADLNNDKNLDLITVGGTKTSRLFVQLGDGDRTFHSPASQPPVSGSVNEQIAVTDFNLDGNPDIALVAKFSARHVDGLRAEWQRRWNVQLGLLFGASFADTRV